jgi:hypothetical protein
MELVAAKQPPGGVFIVAAKARPTGPVAEILGVRLTNRRTHIEVIRADLSGGRERKRRGRDTKDRDRRGANHSSS